MFSRANGGLGQEETFAGHGGVVEDVAARTRYCIVIESTGSTITL